MSALASKMGQTKKIKPRQKSVKNLGQFLSNGVSRKKMLLRFTDLYLVDSKKILPMISIYLELDRRLSHLAFLSNGVSRKKMLLRFTDLYPVDSKKILPMMSIYLALDRRLSHLALQKFLRMHFPCSCLLCVT